MNSFQKKLTITGPRKGITPVLTWLIDSCGCMPSDHAGGRVGWSPSPTHFDPVVGTDGCDANLPDPAMLPIINTP